LAKGSINGLLSKEMIELAPNELEFAQNLPLYSHDYYEDFLDVVKARGRGRRPALEPCLLADEHT
jgi:hypothetical protein